MNSKTRLVRGSLVVAIGLVAVAACDKPRNDSAPAPAPAPSPELRSGAMNTPGDQPLRQGEVKQGEVRPTDALSAADPDMKKVLEQLAALGGKPIESLPPAEARKQPGPADAVKALLVKEGKSAAPIQVAKVEQRKIAGPAGAQLGVRIVTPKGADVKKPYPVVVYFHGGGWVIGGNDAYDSSIRGLANKAGAIVVSPEYRLAPENKFPAQHDDAYATYEWAVKNAASFGGDPKRVAVAGESAGGNLAANVSIMARDKGFAMPVHELLVYPIASSTMDTQSYRDWAKAKPLNKDMMGYFFDKTQGTSADLKDARLDLGNAKLDRLPPTTIVLAEIDPLRSEGEELGKKLKAAGVDIDTKIYEGVTHEFFGMGAVVGDAKDAMDWAGGRLETALKPR